MPPAALAQRLGHVTNLTLLASALGGTHSGGLSSAKVRWLMMVCLGVSRAYVAVQKGINNKSEVYIAENLEVLVLWA
jgi:hypothetical protein